MIKSHLIRLSPTAIVLLIPPILHLPFLFLPSLNLEFAFADAARYFHTGDQSLLDQYFRFQANSVGYPFLIALVAKLLHTEDLLLVGRVLSLIGSVILGVSLLNLLAYLRLPCRPIYVLIMLMNPLVWVFSARSTADLLPASLAAFSISLLFSPSVNYTTIITSAFILGFAGVLKYHVLAVLVILPIFTFFDPIGFLSPRKAALFAITSLSIVAVFVFYTRIQFGFWLTPPVYQNVLAPNAQLLGNNIFLYAGYLSILGMPITLFFLLSTSVRYNRALVVLSSILLFSAGYLFLISTGETNFGPFDRFVDPRVFNGLFVLFTAFTLGSVFLVNFRSYSLLSRRRQLFILSIIVVLSSFSFSRPAQRYLLVLLPFFLVALPLQKLSIYKTLPFLFLFTAMNAFSGYSQWCKGGAAQDIAFKIKSLNLLTRTDPGPIVFHVGDQFKLSSTPDYIVVHGIRSNALVTASRGIPNASVEFSLVPYRDRNGDHD